MDYDLARLGTREFEHLSQALAIAVLGPSVTVFGDGPDGGREAAFTASTPIPIGKKPWNGYAVMQAKFRVGGGSRESDSEWLMKHLKRELSAWVSSRKRIRRPQYILIVTNARLSGVSQQGGIDSVARLLDSYRLPIGLYDWAVWHYDTVCRLLDQHPQIRETYDAFLTTGDILAELRDQLSRKVRRGAQSIAATYVAQELVSNSIVRDAETGAIRSEGFPIGKIAIDLRAVGSGGEIDRLVNNLAERGNQIFSRSNDHTRSSRGCVVLLGGPGQGKSTIGQLLCQMYRCAFVRARPANLLGAEAAFALSDIETDLSKAGFQFPVARRWPISLSLATYAEYIKKNRPIPLLRYMANKIREQVSGEFTDTDLRNWLSRWPSVVVLDSLDEVSERTTRQSVLESISYFLTEMGELESDAYVLVTTRPQGYRRELKERIWDHLSIAPLSNTEALRYATRLAKCRTYESKDQVQQLLARIAEATKTAHTARLLTTPLQVSIMTLLLEKKNRLPRHRFALFDAYYETIYAREVAKEGEVGELLEMHRDYVDYVHDKVASLLQARGEKDQEMQLSENQLNNLTETYLLDEGHGAVGALLLAQKVLTACRERLVLLVPTASGEAVQFEVRSFQEFMAARAMFRDTDADALNRLEIAARSDYWRNSWLFAVGFLFSKRKGLRDSIVASLRALDIEGPSSRIVAPGALAALAILQDDILENEPKYQRIVLTHAMELASRPRIPASRELARVAAFRATSEESRAIIAVELSKHFRDPGLRRVFTFALIRELRSLDFKHPMLAVHRDSTFEDENAAREKSLRDPERRAIAEICGRISERRDLRIGGDSGKDGPLSTRIPLAALPAGRKPGGPIDTFRSALNSVRSNNDGVSFQVDDNSPRDRSREVAQKDDTPTTLASFASLFADPEVQYAVEYLIPHLPVSCWDVACLFRHLLEVQYSETSVGSFFVENDELYQ